MMKLETLANNIGVSFDEILDRLDKDERRKKFFYAHSEQLGNDFEMDSYATHTILEMLEK